MNQTWKLGQYRGKPMLFPVQDELADQCYQLAVQVPGVNAQEEDGTVRGPINGLVACYVAAGQPVPPELRRMVHTRKLDTMSGGYGASPIHGLPEFQVEGWRTMALKYGAGIMNNDDMGLGKTVQTIASMQAVDPNVAKLVLCPAFLRPQWASEIQRWTQALGNREPSIQVIWPRADRRSKKPVNLKAEWIVAFYLDAERALEFVDDRRYVLIVDELHNLRNVGKMRYEALEMASLSAYGRIGLTASELYNDPTGLWPMYNIVSPGQWGKRWQFMTRYLGAVFNEWGGLAMPEVEGTAGRFTLQNVDELNARRALHSIRRIKQDVWSQLPFDAKIQVIWLEPTGNTRDELAAAMLGGIEDQHGHLERVSMGKVPDIVEQVRSDVQAGLPGLTFTYLKKQAEHIAKDVTGALLVTGDNTTSSKRIEKINDYVARCKVSGVAPQVVATMDSLSEGVNCQWAKVVNFGAVDPTPDKTMQCMARSVRMGQEGTIPVRIFARRYSLDERLVDLNRQKLAAQEKLAGRREQGKADLDAAFTPPGLKDALATMYERYLKLEKSEA